jgi:hypothetical protein
MEKIIQLLITGIKRRPDVPEDLFLLAARQLRLPRKALLSVKIKRKAIDARNKQRVYFVYTLEAKIDVQKVRDINAIIQMPGVRPLPAEEDWLENLPVPLVKKAHPLVIGNGPAGLFAAALLASQGTSPIVLERGSQIAQRVDDVEQYWRKGILNPESNVQFGEGGAGTFSDGKLTTRTSDVRMEYVLATLADAGAGKDILYQQRPHVGTDRLRNVISKIRAKLEKAGVHFEFNARVDDFFIEDNILRSIRVAGEEYDARHGTVLAIGNAARDTFSLLNEKGISLTAKPFAVGFRIEHPRELIDQSQFGAFAGNRELGAACYNYTWQTTEGRGVYTFCMCPGGQVIGASSEADGLVVNGMSLYSRHQDNSNSAIVATVGPADFGEGVFAGMEYQRDLERAAFILGGSDHRAPVQRVGDYLAGVTSTGMGTLAPSYQPGVKWTDLSSLLTSELNAGIREAILEFARKLKGFSMEDAILTGIETRTSSPVRIERSASGESVSLANLFPAGEGSGYAGGIVSSAVDGLRAAENLLRKL